ncbi:MAG: terminase large subunit domain-containing protein [Candidatus Bathyarchaeia archaeon]
MCASKFDLKLLLQLVDPVVWLEAHTGFKPFPHQAQLIRDYRCRLRVVRKARQIGITTAIAQEAIWRTFTRLSLLILIVSPSGRQSDRPMRIIQGIVDNSPELAAHVINENRNELSLDNGSSILALPNNPDRLRNYSADDIYLDEAAHFLNDEPVMAAIRPMLIAKAGSFTIVSTPFGKRGLFWDQYNVALGQMGVNPLVKAYEMYPSWISPLIKKADIEEQLKTGEMSEFEYRQEYLGEFIEQTDTYLPLELITSCVDSSLTNLQRGGAGKLYAGGVDFAKRRDETVIVLVEVERDGMLTVQYIESLQGSGKNRAMIDYSNQIGRIGQIGKVFPIRRFEADETGVGVPVLEDLRRVMPQTQGIYFTASMKLELASGLRTLLEQKRLKIPNNKKLIMQMNGLHYQVSKTGNMVFESPEKDKLHDDYLWALALACHAGRRVDRSKPIFRQPIY